VLFGVAWALATPVGAPPDEAAHIIRADVLFHGQLIGTPGPKGSPRAVTEVHGPEDLIALIPESECLNGNNVNPASCTNTYTKSARTINGFTYVGRYPPFYYFFVGLPTLVSQSLSVVYLMRTVSVMLSAVFLALAFAGAWRWGRSRILFGAITIAITPMAMYMAAAVNPNGLEISSAICAWTTGLLLFVERSDVPPGLLASFATSAIVLALSRGLSPLWLAAILVFVGGLAGARRCRTILAARATWWWIGAGAVTAAFVVAWDVGEQTFNFLVGNPAPRHASLLHFWIEVVGRAGGYLQQFIGVFGSLETPVPTVTFLAWIAAGSLLVLGALIYGKRRESLVLVVLFASCIVIPALLDASQAHRYGFIEQGRYYLPLVAGVPLLAGLILSRSRLSGSEQQRAAAVTVGLGVFGQIAAFVWTLHRYTVGAGGPINPFDRLRDGWLPPLGAPGLDAAMLVISLVFAGWVLTRAAPPTDAAQPSLLAGAP
jgi:hypothetical protein